MNRVCYLQNTMRQNLSYYVNPSRRPKLPEQNQLLSITTYYNNYSLKTDFKKIKAFLFSASLLFIVVFSQFNLQAQTKTLGYAEATYSGLIDNEFLKNWLILGPVKINESGNIPDGASQKAFFDKELLKSVVVLPNKVVPKIKIGNTEYVWKSVKSEEGIVDFVKLIGQFNYSTAYALAEIWMDAPVKVLVGVGSDDDIKIFLNGALVHTNWIARPINPDDDIVSLNLKKGSNQILIKVQNIEQGWSFAIRKLGKDAISNLLIESADKGNFVNLKVMADNGADINAQNGLGLTAFQSASIKGREKVMNYLIEKGAKTDVPMPPFNALVDNIFKSVQTGITSGVSVLVSKKGEIIYEKGFGYADIGNKVPVTPDTKFRIGSITKQFTASAILKLQEEGKISVTDKLSKFIPDFPRGDEVTIHHLLTHTSGIHSFFDRPSFLKYVTLSITPKSLVDSIKTWPYDFNPGDRYLYNNSGYFILGYIIENISEKSLGEYLSETFFKPLGMNSTGIYANNLLLDHEAYGYSIENGKITKALNWDMSWVGGAGALYSTVRDLYTWNEAIFNGKVLKKESLKAAFTPVTLNYKEKSDYGYGWSFQNFRGLKFVGHEGFLHGFQSALEHQPENKVTVALLCNSTPPLDGSKLGSIALSITEYLLWKEMQKQSGFPTDLSIDEWILKSYEGRYDYGQGLMLMVTLDGKQLNAQITGQPLFPLFPSSQNEFNWIVYPAKVKFVTDENGNVTNLIHYQGGQQFVAKKLKD